MQIGIRPSNEGHMEIKVADSTKFGTIRNKIRSKAASDEEAANP